MSSINIKNGNSIVFKRNTIGELLNAYTPLLNLINSKNILGDFTTSELKYDRYTPIDMVITDEYDGSENIIINDDINLPRLINSGFSVLENNTFSIPEHSGNSVTNVYEENTFEKDTQLLKLYTTIPTLTFKGIKLGGTFKCGSYVFYFKLSDSDGNLSNIIQESGIVLIHIGTPNSKKVRMGLADENADKSVKFELSNIDRGFDYVKVFFERRSSDASQATIASYFMITLNFPIRNGKCDILLTGEENSLLIDKTEINTNFADIQSAKTLAIVDNTLFLGNISSYKENYQLLLQIAWRIIPRYTEQLNLGSVSSLTYDLEGRKAYYNINNVYDNTGYWADEFYRFGIVYVFDNNLLSPVFNIQGCDLSSNPSTESFFKDPDLTEKRYAYEQEPDDFIFRRKGWHNSRGVVKFPLKLLFKCTGGGSVSPISLKIEFDFSHITSDYFKDTIASNEELKTFLIQNHIKGFFFVRLKRIPTIIAQGMVIGLTGRYNGALPVLKNLQGDYITKSFLNNGRLLLKDGSSITITSEVKNKALLIPDYDINEATLNQIFTGQEFQLTKLYSSSYKIDGDHHCVNNIVYDNSSEKKIISDVKLTAIPKGTKIKTDGTNYFSSLAGNPTEAYKTEDVNNIWNRTVPQELTASTSLVRGNWGSYVGMSTDQFEYGDIVNIKLNDFKDPELIHLEFEKRFKDFSFYSSISPRYNIDEICGNTSNRYVICGRGDCFPSVFTHRMMSNFIDPELPTNLKIIDPACWAKNYGVRCTAEILLTTHSNLTADTQGWYIPSPTNKKSAIVSIIFGILTGNIGSVINAISDLSTSSASKANLDKYANEIVQAFEVYVGKDSKHEPSIASSTADDGTVSNSTNLETLIKAGHIKKVEPKRQDQEGGTNYKAIFKSDDKWELHGLASINRADVNAVSYGSWITFPVCSQYNLAFRDIDFYNATEETTMNKKRGFFPWEEMNQYDHLLESNIINGACKISISSNLNPGYTTVPYIKLEFFNRIYWSKPNVSETFINSYRMIFNNLYREYNKEFGAITKLLSLGNSLFVVFLHGLGILPVNRSPLNEAEASPYLSSRSVLPSLVQTLSKDYGSMWKDSVLLSQYTNYIYGVDTIAKKIWRVTPDGQKLEFISDHKINKFLNTWIDLSEYDYKEYQGHINVKTHYNAFKHDVMFTYYKDIPVYKTIYSLPKEYSPSKYKINEDNIITTLDGIPITLSPIIYKYNKRVLTFNDSPHYAYREGSNWYAENINTGERILTLPENFVNLLDATPEQETAYYEALISSPISSNLMNISESGYVCEFNKRFAATPNEYIKAEERSIIDYWKPGKTWNLCYNEETLTWVTFYDWYPVESCNIDNIYFSFDKESIDDTFKNEHINNLKEINSSYYEINKMFIDKAFTHNTLVYFCNNLNIAIDSTKSHSFYYKGTCLLNNTSLPELYQRTFGYDNTWKYVYLPSNAGSIITVNGQISELKEVSAEVTPVTNDPILAFWDLRTSEENRMYLWKHGYAGLYDNQGKIKPTNWYGKLHEFNFEFVVAESPQVLKIFNNLKIISNKTAPNKFEYEIVGEGYDWHKYKPIIKWINEHSSNQTLFEINYKEILLTPYNTLKVRYPDFPDMWEWEGKLILRIPFLHIETCDRKGKLDKSYWKREDNPDYWDTLTPDLQKDYKFSYNCSETVLNIDELLNEQRVHTESLGNDMSRYGRVKGNMLYLEDLWDIEIRPVNIKWAYLDHNTLKLKSTETKHRDKYIKIKVRYTGEDLALIQGVISTFDISYA